VTTSLDAEALCLEVTVKSSSDEIVRTWAEISDMRNWSGIEAIGQGYISTAPLAEGARRLPWPGYIGPRYEENRLLLIGINGGVLSSVDEQRAESNRRMYLKLATFTDHPTADTLKAFMAECEKHIPTWRFWNRATGHTGMLLQDVAYINVLAVHTVHPQTGGSIPFSALL
jgi:hypothetical protein